MRRWQARRQAGWDLHEQQNFIFQGIPGVWARAFGFWVVILVRPEVLSHCLRTLVGTSNFPGFPYGHQEVFSWRTLDLS